MAYIQPGRLNVTNSSYNKRFIQFSDYAKADMKDIFGEKLKTATYYTASQMSSLLLENTGTGFTVHQLPMQAQWSPVYSINILDVTGMAKRTLLPVVTRHIPG